MPIPFLSCFKVEKNLDKLESSSPDNNSSTMDKSRILNLFDSRNPNSHTVKAKKGTADTVDFYEILFEYVKKFPFASDVKKAADMNLRMSDVIESKLKVYNKPAVYDDEEEDSDNVTKMATKKPKNNILFSSVFQNKTSEQQTHHLSAERRTSSSCTIAVCKAMTKGCELQLEVAPPNAIVKANAGFRKEITVENDNEQTIEEELTWSVNTEIIVPSGKRTRADLVITESSYQGFFRIETIMEGIITVAIRDRKTNAIICPIVINNLSDVFTPELGFNPVPDKPNAVSYINEGKCSCQFGVAQRIDLTEESL